MTMTAVEGRKAIRKRNKKYRHSEKGKTMNREAVKRHSSKYPEQKIAVQKLNNLLISGGISNSNFICAICGKQPIEKHHENYDIWYSFISLCKECHSDTSFGREIAC